MWYSACYLKSSRLSDRIKPNNLTLLRYAEVCMYILYSKMDWAMTVLKRLGCREKKSRKLPILFQWSISKQFLMENSYLKDIICINSLFCWLSLWCIHVCRYSLDLAGMKVSWQVHGFLKVAWHQMFKNLEKYFKMSDFYQTRLVSTVKDII